MTLLNLQKPVRGTALLEKRERRAETVRHEQREMQAALNRDHRKCRNPRCEFVGKKLPIDPAHQRHRGMGGNAKGDRTTCATVIALCRLDHSHYDAGDLEIEPLTDRGFDGPCAFYRLNRETGRLEHIASETTIGVSVTR